MLGHDVRAGEGMELRSTSLIEKPLAEAAGVLNAGFSDYLAKVAFDIPMLLRMIKYDQIDCSLSRVVEHDGRDLGAALIARRGWTSRLAAMAVIPEARGNGVGGWLVDSLLQEAEARGDRAMGLEVIEGNDPAIGLYESRGFKVRRRLLSFQAPPGPAAGDDNLQETDVRDIAGHVTRHGLPHLPWQVSGESLAQMGPPFRGYQLQGAYAVLSDPEAATIAIRALVTDPENRGKGQAKRLLRALMARYPDKSWSIPALCPQEIEPVFVKAGFTRGDLSQLQMARVIA
jgi:ribosomal protein S18 acetylase RimI-like enzyme